MPSLAIEDPLQPRSAALRYSSTREPPIEPCDRSRREQTKRASSFFGPQRAESLRVLLERVYGDSKTFLSGARNRGALGVFGIPTHEA